MTWKCWFPTCATCFFTGTCLQLIFRLWSFDNCLKINFMNFKTFYKQFEYVENEIWESRQWTSNLTLLSPLPIIVLGFCPPGVLAFDMATFRTSRSIHPKVKEVIVQLSYWIPEQELAFYLDVHPRTVKRICKIFEETGEVVRPSPVTRGHPRMVEWEQGMVSFLSFLVCRVSHIFWQYIERVLKKHLEMMHSEIQDRILDKYGSWISLSTISCLLKQHEQTYKQVWNLFNKKLEAANHHYRFQSVLSKGTRRRGQITLLTWLDLGWTNWYLSMRVQLTRELLGAIGDGLALAVAQYWRLI